MKLNFQINLTDKQQEAYDILHNPECQFLVARWSRQCGKTVFAEVMLIEYLCKPNLFNAYISPTFQLGRKVYGEITKLLEPTGIIKKANASTLTIESTFGSTLQFFSIEAYTSIRGTTVSGILVLDEMAYYPDILPNGEQPWGNVIYPIIKARKPKVLAISTPRGKRGDFYTLYLRALEDNNKYRELTATIYDDNLITNEDIDEIKKSISEIAFRQEFMVEWLDSSLTFFSGFEDCFKTFKYDDNQRQYIGVDLSTTGEDATILTKLNDNMQVQSILISGTLDQKYKQIANIINNTRNLVGAYLENNGVGTPMINEIKKLVLHKSRIHEWTTTNNTKEQIVSNLAVKIANKEIVFNEEDKRLWSELGSFIVKYTKTGKMQFEAMNGKHDDTVMSLGIALQAKEDLKYYATRNVGFARSGTKVLN